MQDRTFTKPDLLGIDILVTEMSTNKTYLYEAVKSVTGKSVMEYINYLRLEDARSLLNNHPELTVEIIANDCGFNSSRTFYRLFFDQYRITPAEYRKMAKSLDITKQSSRSAIEP